MICEICGKDYGNSIHFYSSANRTFYGVHQPKLDAFEFSVWLMKLEDYVQDRFNGRGAGL